MRMRSLAKGHLRSCGEIGRVRGGVEVGRLGFGRAPATRQGDEQTSALSRRAVDDDLPAEVSDPLAYADQANATAGMCGFESNAVVFDRQLEVVFRAPHIDHRERRMRMLEDVGERLLY